MNLMTQLKYIHCNLFNRTNQKDALQFKTLHDILNLQNDFSR